MPSYSQSTFTSQCSTVDQDERSINQITVPALRETERKREFHNYLHGPGVVPWQSLIKGTKQIMISGTDLGGNAFKFMPWVVSSLVSIKNNYTNKDWLVTLYHCNMVSKDVTHINKQSPEDILYIS